MYTREEKLKIHQRIGVTKQVYQILRREKQKHRISMAKIVCNLVLQNLNKKSSSKNPVLNGASPQKKSVALGMLPPPQSDFPQNQKEMNGVTPQ